MFTEEIYRQYFVQIHRKQREMIILLRNGLRQISEDRMQKALSWHMKREIRLAVMVQKLVRMLSPESNGGEGRISNKDTKVAMEIIAK